MTVTRNEPFVPLTTAAPHADVKEFRATILSQAEGSRAIAAPADLPRAPHAGCEPRVTVQREGAQVSGIRIECACGQVIDLACVYQPNPPLPA